MEMLKLNDNYYLVMRKVKIHSVFTGGGGVQQVEWCFIRKCTKNVRNFLHWELIWNLQPPPPPPPPTHPWILKKKVNWQ